ncbi:MAG: hypothetical protein M3P12_00570 [Gemmatimonadota bacterium]|nr:hypothetical protein [Gemmatimonadota bacterium]
MLDVRSTLDLGFDVVERSAKIVIVVIVVLALFVMDPAAMRAQTSTGLRSQVVDAKTRRELETAREAVWRAWFAGDSVALERLIPKVLAAGTAGQWEDRAMTLKPPWGKRTTVSGVAAEVFVREDGRWVNPFWYLK